MAASSKASKKGARTPTNAQGKSTSKTPTQGKKEPAHSTGGNRNITAAVALRNRCRGYAPGFEGMVSLYLAAHPDETIGTMRIPRVFGWYSGIASGGETTRQTNATSARRQRPSRAKTTAQTGEQTEATQPTPEPAAPEIKGKARGAGQS